MTRYEIAMRVSRYVGSAERVARWWPLDKSDDNAFITHTSTLFSARLRHAFNLFADITLKL